MYNARTFFDMLQKEIARSRRYGRPLSLIYLDIDNFKTVNDSHGHQTGNSVLSAVAAGLLQSVRRMDVVARLGGDEYSILLPETDEAAARTTVERVRENLGRETAKGLRRDGQHRGRDVQGAGLHGGRYRPHRGRPDVLVKRGGKNGVRFAVVPE